VIFGTLAQQIRVCALKAGFDLAGVAPLAARTDLEFARTWVENGYGGEMAYLRNPKRADPRLILPSARSVVCVGLVYNTALPYSTEVGRQFSLGTRQLSVTESQKWEAGNRQRITNNEHFPAAFEPAANVASSRGDAVIPAKAGIQPADITSPTTGAMDSRLCGNDGASKQPPREATGWISRYAWGRDYHQAMRSRLEHLRAAIEKLAPGVETRVYVDTGPIVERAFARLSGIGWVGKNTCLINQQKGSWFFLGVILTSLELESDAPAFDRCGSCTRCLEACPTGALAEPYVMDASRCISYLNIELKGPIPSELRPAIGANLFGCDICQDVCPWNRPLSVVGGPLTEPEDGTARKGRRQVATTELPEFQPITVEHAQQPFGTSLRVVEPQQRTTDNGQRTDERFSLFHPRLQDLASLTEEDFRRIFRDSPIKRVKYRGWLRNLCVVMGNSGDVRFIPCLERTLQEQEDAVVREHAEWALQRLRDLSQ